MPPLGISLEVCFNNVKGGRGHLESRTSLSELSKANTAPRDYRRYRDISAPSHKADTRMTPDPSAPTNPKGGKALN